MIAWAVRAMAMRMAAKLMIAWAVRVPLPFEGDWRHRRWHGYGRASFSNGDSYEGEYKFDQRHSRKRFLRVESSFSVFFLFEEERALSMVERERGNQRIFLSHQYPVFHFYFCPSSRCNCTSLQFSSSLCLALNETFKLYCLRLKLTFLSTDWSSSTRSGPYSVYELQQCSIFQEPSSFRTSLNYQK